MFDEKRLYMKQLLRNYKRDPFEMPMCGYDINYRYPDDIKDRHRLISHNEGIDIAIQYIDKLERKVDELQYIESIISAAKENCYGMDQCKR